MSRILGQIRAKRAELEGRVELLRKELTDAQDELAEVFEAPHTTSLPTPHPSPIADQRAVTTLHATSQLNDHQFLPSRVRVRTLRRGRR
jgi:hypothetical protein